MNSNVSKILIQTGKAISLNEVARQIAYVGEQLGLITILNRHYLTYPFYKGYFDAVIFVYPSSPAWCTQWFYHYVKAKKELNGKAIYYTTIEGIPKKQVIADWVFREVEFIACSKYVKKCLEKVGLKVIDVIPHGYPEFEIQQAEELSLKYTSLINERFKDKVVFGYIGDFNFRKGLDYLLQAIKLLSQRRNDFVVLIISKPEVIRKIQDIPNTVFIGEFGTRNHVEIMGFYKAIDYLLFPSLAEGFGLPLLEANVVGTPAIITDLPSFREYCDLKANFVTPVKNVQILDVGDGILYEIHYYDIKDLVNEMENAIEIHKKYPSEYVDRSAKVKEKVKDLKSEILYRKFFQLLGYVK